LLDVRSARRAGHAANGCIQFLVDEVQPRGALVVQVGQGALFEFGCAIVVAGFEARIPDSPDTIFVGFDEVGRPRSGGAAEIVSYYKSHEQHS
jgi:hypothetical protein